VRVAIIHGTILYNLTKHFSDDSIEYIMSDWDIMRWNSVFKNDYVYHVIVGTLGKKYDGKNYVIISPEGANCSFIVIRHPGEVLKGAYATMKILPYLSDLFVGTALNPCLYPIDCFVTLNSGAAILLQYMSISPIGGVIPTVYFHAETFDGDYESEDPGDNEIFAKNVAYASSNTFNVFKNKADYDIILTRVKKYLSVSQVSKFMSNSTVGMTLVDYIKPSYERNPKILAVSGRYSNYFDEGEIKYLDVLYKMGMIDKIIYTMPIGGAQRPPESMLKNRPYLEYKICGSEYVDVVKEAGSFVSTVSSFNRTYMELFASGCLPFHFYDSQEDYPYSYDYKYNMPAKLKTPLNKIKDPNDPKWVTLFKMLSEITIGQRKEIVEGFRSEYSYENSVRPVLELFNRRVREDGMFGYFDFEKKKIDSIVKIKLIQHLLEYLNTKDSIRFDELTKEAKSLLEGYIIAWDGSTLLRARDLYVLMQRLGWQDTYKTPIAVFTKTKESEGVE
jgi:hypothetical protein